MPKKIIVSQSCPHMARVDMRMFKRLVVIGTQNQASDREVSHSRDSLLQLLARSVRLGHHRLALIRLNQAVPVGAEVTLEHWKYRERVILACLDTSLLDIFLDAKRPLTISNNF